MKKILLFTLSFLFSLSIFGRTIIVHDKCDKRLKGYKDSIACYYYGIFQVEAAKRIDRRDTAQGRMLYDIIVKKNEVLNQNIKPIGTRKDLSILVSEKLISSKKISSTEIDEQWEYLSWSPDIYAKPVLTVIYEKPEETKPVDTVKPSVHKYESVFLTQKKDSVIWIPSGKKISKDAFINRYGKETYNKLVKQNK